MAALLDRDAELTELGRRLGAARAGSGRVIVVEGPAGIGKSTLLAAAGRMARDDGTTFLLARCSPLEQHAAWGMASQLFEPLRARPEWAELTVGAAGLAERALAPEAGEPAPAGDAMHAAARGLVWLTSNLGERGPAVLAVDDIHWADAPSLRWLAVLVRSLDELPIGGVVRRALGRPGGRAGAVGRGVGGRAGAAGAPAHAGAGGDRDARAGAAGSGEPGVRPRLPRCNRRQPVPARRTLDPARRRCSPTGRRDRRAARDLRVRAGRARPRAPAGAVAGRRRSARPRCLRARPRRPPAPRRRTRPTRPCTSGPRRRRATRRRSARPGTRAGARPPPDRRHPLLQPARRRAGAAARTRRSPARTRTRRTRTHRPPSAACPTARERRDGGSPARRGRARHLPRRPRERGHLPAPRGRRTAARPHRRG